MADMVNEKRENFEIDLKKLMWTYLSKWWLILISVVVAALLSYWYTIYFVTPMYKASVTVYVNNTKAGEQVTYISSSNLATAQRLVNTYIHIIESDTVLTKVADESGLNVSASTLRSVMSATQIGDTELFKVYITHPDPGLAEKIANAVAKVAPGEIERFVEGSSTKIVDYARVPSSPSSPNISKNCFVGGLIGVVLAFAYLTVCFLMDVCIRGEDELVALFDIPVLSQIPIFVTEGAKRRNSYDTNTYRSAADQQKGGVKDGSL